MLWDYPTAKELLDFDSVLNFLSRINQIFDSFVNKVLSDFGRPQNTLMRIFYLMRGNIFLKREGLLRLLLRQGQRTRHLVFLFFKDYLVCIFALQVRKSILPF